MAYTSPPGCQLRNFKDPNSCCSDISACCSDYLTYDLKNAFWSIPSSNSCTWLEKIISSRNYTSKDVWQDILPASIYNPNITICYGKLYMECFGLSNADDYAYSFSRGELIPNGLSSLAAPCITSACQGSGYTGNPDIAGIGVSSFFRGTSSCPQVY